MHERSLVRALLRQVEHVAAEHPSCRILTIRLCIGEFSGVEPELLATAYGHLVRDTPLRDAALELKYVPLEATCEQCGGRFRVERFKFKCVTCGSVRLVVTGGEEMLLESVTFEEVVA